MSKSVIDRFDARLDTVAWASSYLFYPGYVGVNFVASRLGVTGDQLVVCRMGALQGFVFGVTVAAGAYVASAKATKIAISFILGGVAALVRRETINHWDRSAKIRREILLISLISLPFDAINTISLTAGASYQMMFKGDEVVAANSGLITGAVAAGSTPIALVTPVAIAAVACSKKNTSDRANQWRQWKHLSITLASTVCGAAVAGPIGAIAVATIIGAVSGLYFWSSPKEVNTKNKES